MGDGMKLILTCKLKKCKPTTWYGRETKRAKVMICLLCKHSKVEEVGE